VTSPSTCSHVARFALPVALAACSKQPAEIAPEAKASSEAVPAIAPLLWDAPSLFTRVDPPKNGPRKAAYKVDKAGADKEETTVDVLFFGTGAKGDVEANFKEWFAQFDGDLGATATREKLRVGELEVEVVDTKPSTFKVPLTPPVGPKKQPPVQMVKSGFRLHGAAVRTKDRGTWFFRMIGPDETVQAARPAFRKMLESVR
jgi:hypothetical protein